MQKITDEQTLFISFQLSDPEEIDSNVFLTANGHLPLRHLSKKENVFRCDAGVRTNETCRVCVCVCAGVQSFGLRRLEVEDGDESAPSEYSLVVLLFTNLNYLDPR